MKSTGYIIELLVAGAGTVLWIGLLLVAFFGMAWVPFEMLQEPGLLIILSPFIYGIGVITDRAIDDLFDRIFKENEKNPKFLSREAYFEARTRIYLASEALTEHMDYNKLRIRICRAWAVNATLTLIAANLWLIFPHTPLTGPLRWQGALAINIILGLSIWQAFRAWRKLSEKEARYLSHQAQILKRWEEQKTTSTLEDSSD